MYVKLTEGRRLIVSMRSPPVTYKAVEGCILQHEFRRVVRGLFQIIYILIARHSRFHRV